MWQNRLLNKSESNYKIDQLLTGAIDSTDQIQNSQKAKQDFELLTKRYYHSKLFELA